MNRATTTRAGLFAEFPHRRPRASEPSIDLPSGGCTAAVYQSASWLPVKKPTSDDAVSTSSMRPDHFQGVNTNPANGRPTSWL